jgi:ketosteroid isomerase-like protein
MKMRLLGILAGLAIATTLPGFAQQTVDPKIEQQIRMLAMKYDSAINSHDANAIAALYTQDAVFWTHHDGSFRGRQAIEKEYAQWYFKRWNKHNLCNRDHSGNCGRQWHTCDRNMTCDYSYGVNDSHRDYGDVWWVLVREGDTWKIRKDTQTGTPWPTQ